MAQDEQRSGAHFSRGAGTGPVMASRRTFIAGIVGLGAVAAGAAVASGLGLFGAGEPEPAGTVRAPMVSHRGGVANEKHLFFHDTTTGSIIRCDHDGTNPVTLYSNGQPDRQGIYLLMCDSDSVYFCDVPTRELRAISEEGGEPRTLYSAAGTELLPLPLSLSGGLVYFSLYERETRSSTLCSIGTTATDGAARTHCDIPQGFLPYCVNSAGTRVWYAGVAEDDTRQIRSSDLSGDNELVGFSFDGVPSATSSITWQISLDRLYVEFQDDSTLTDRIASYAHDGTDERVIHDFATQKVLFDAVEDSLVVIDRETFAVMTLDPTNAEAAPTTLATIPHEAASVVNYLEVSPGACWVTTSVPGQDAAVVLSLFHVSLEDGSVTQLV